MPPAAVGAAFVALGASAATGATITALVTAAYVGAAVGAVVGAATAAITGGNILKGALKGAALGFISGGLLKGAGIAMGAGTAAGEAAGAGVGEAGLTAGESAAAGSAPAGVDIATGLTAENATAAQAIAGGGPPATAAPATPTLFSSGEGLLSKAAGWIEKNPTLASALGQGLAGGAKSMLESKGTDKYIESLMERDRLNRDALVVKGLDTLQLRMPLPSIAKFTERPAWQIPESGLIWGGMQNATKTATT